MEVDLRFAGARLRVADPVLPRLAEPAEDARAGAASSSPIQLPDITRCAASATASAIKVPSLLALDIAVVAA